jgi:hypothetical protein
MLPDLRFFALLARRAWHMITDWHILQRKYG